MSADINAAMRAAERALRSEISERSVSRAAIHLSIAVSSLKAAASELGDGPSCTVCSDHGCEFCPDSLAHVIPFPGTEAMI